MIFNFRPFLGLNSIEKHDVHHDYVSPFPKPKLHPFFVVVVVLASRRPKKRSRENSYFTINPHLNAKMTGEFT